MFQLLDVVIGFLVDIWGKPWEGPFMETEKANTDQILALRAMTPAQRLAAAAKSGCSRIRKNVEKIKRTPLSPVWRPGLRTYFCGW
jgi:hypothetical protein